MDWTLWNIIERVAEWLRRLTRKPKVRTVIGSNPALESLVAVRNSSPGRPEQCEGNLVAAAGSCGGLMVKHPWPLLEISLSDIRRLATLNINTYLPTHHRDGVSSENNDSCCYGLSSHNDFYYREGQFAAPQGLYPSDRCVA